MILNNNDIQNTKMKDVLSKLKYYISMIEVAIGILFA